MGFRHWKASIFLWVSVRFNSPKNSHFEVATPIAAVELGVFLQPPAMTDHRLSIDGKWEVFFGDFLDPNGWRQASWFNGGDVTFRLTFTPWPLSFAYRGALITREFRWVAVKVGEKWRWVPKTIDKDYRAPRRAFSERFKVRK